ncbi:MAG TPA: hypothetical protein VER14_09970 [Phototrophicaceae bacterium]|nr:hypothetical protein [Phototrophicaceae bacterium]
MEKAIRFSKTRFALIIAFMMFTGTVNIINIIDPAIWSKEPITSKIDNNNSTASNNFENPRNNNQAK